MKPTRYILVTTNNVQVRVGLSYITALLNHDQATYSHTTTDEWAVTEYYNGAYNVIQPLFS